MNKYKFQNKQGLFFEKTIILFKIYKFVPLLCCVFSEM